MTDIAAWSPIDDNNNSASPAGFPEGMLPSGVNNSARAVQGATRRFYERFNPALDPTGSENDIILTYDPVPAPVGGDVFWFTPAAANTGPATLNVGTGAIPIWYGAYGAPGDLRGGELQPGVMVAVVMAGGTPRWYLSAAAGGPLVAGLPLVIAGGSGNSVSIIYGTGAPTALTAGDRFTVFLSATNTGPATLSVQGMGAAAIFAQGSPLTGGELVTNAVVDFVWDGANFHLLDPAMAGVFMPLAGGTFTGPVTAPSVTSTGNITAATGSVAALNLAGTNASVTNTLQAGALVSNGTITATTSVNATQYNLRGNTFAIMDAGGIQTTIYRPGAVQTITLTAAGTSYYDNGQHQFRASTAGATFAYFNSVGTYNASGSWIAISDAAWKTDVEPFTERGLAAIQALHPVSFRYSGGPFAGERRQYGLIAQDAMTVVPEMVEEATIDGEQVLTMQPGMLMWILVNSIHEMAARLEALEAKP